MEGFSRKKRDSINKCLEVGGNLTQSKVNRGPEPIRCPVYCGEGHRDRIRNI